MDDWQIGDLALCVGSDDADGSKNPLDCFASDAGFVIGSVYIVDGVFPVQYQVGLYFAAHPSGGPHDVWDSECFRKIRPHQPDEQDAETIRLLTGAPATVEA